MSPAKKSLSRSFLIPLLLVVFAFLLALSPIISLDFWWHISVGKLLWENTVFPKIDVFSHTAGTQVWDNREWFFDIVLYTVVKHFGLPGVTLFKALVIALFALLIFTILKYFTQESLLSALLAVLILLASRLIYTERPWIFTLLFSALFILILTHFRDRKSRLIWSLPVIMVVWVNIHPGSVVGLAIIFGFLLDEVFYSRSSFKKAFLSSKGFLILLSVFLTSLLATLINPSAFKRFTAPFELMFGSKEYISVIQETRRPTLEAQPYFFILFVLVIFLWILHIKRTKPSHVFFLVTFGFLALSWKRNIPLFATVSTLLLATSLQSFLNHEKLNLRRFLSEHRRKINRIVVLGLILGCLLVAKSRYFGIGHPLHYFPEETLQYMKKNRLKGNLFNIYDWGGYIMWRAYPQYKVFIDGRGPDVYSMDIWKDYRAVERGDNNYHQILEKYKVEIILISTAEVMINLIRKLDEDPRWSLVFSNLATRLYLKKDGLNADFVEIKMGIDEFWKNLEGYPEKARKIMENIVHRFPDSPHGYFHLGIFLGQKDEDFKNAIGMFEKAIELDPYMVEAYNNLAVVYEILGNSQKALEILRQGLKIEPDSRTLQENLKRLQGKMALKNISS